MYRVKEFSFRPLNSLKDDDSGVGSSTEELKTTKSKSPRTSVWNCDGEVIPHPKLNLK